MTLQEHKAPQAGFTQNLWVSFALIVTLIFVFAIYIWSEKQINLANEQRYLSRMLADELRQSSDDLTRMIRSYAVTLDPVYKQYYQDILDIRNGTKPRPDKYENIYWDFVTAGIKSYQEQGTPVALLEMMKETGFTEEEFLKLAEAKRNSDALTAAEFESIRLIDTAGPINNEAVLEKARMMLFDKNYLQQKGSIMKPIDEFFTLMDNRTRERVEFAELRATVLRYVFALLGLTLIFLLWRTYELLLKLLGGSVDEVYSKISKIGLGDFSSRITVPQGLEDSVIGRLSKTQNRLEQLDSQNKSANSNLEYAYSRINSVVANAMDGIISIHVDGRIESFNPAAERIFGYKADELIGKNISLLMPEPYRSEHDSHIQNYLRTGRSKVIGIVREIPALRKNGEEFPLEISVSETFLENQRLFTGIVRDITERKMAETLLKENEAKLNENERRLRSLIDNTPSVVYMKHADGRYILINKQFTTLFKTTNEEVMGKRDTDLFPKDMATVYMENDRLVVESGESLYVEEAARHDDGLHTYISVKFPLRNDLGNIYGIAGISTDITERKRLEEELKQHQLHLQELVDQKTQALREVNASLACALQEEEAVYASNPDILYVADTQARMTKWNRKMEEVTGYSPSELMGKECVSFFPSEESGHVAQAIQRVFTEGKAEVEAHLLTKSGNLIFYHFNGIPLKSENNETIGFTGTGRDISERKRAEETLRQTQKQLLHAEKLSSLGKLTGSIAHEFNNPLYGMRLLLEEIADEGALDETHKNNLILAIKECDRMANLVKQLQGFYKPSTQNKVETSINQIVEETLLLTQKKMKGKNIALEKNLDPSLPTVKVVEDQIKQVVLNIIQNAEESIPAGRPDGKIIISTKNRGDEILIRFQDNGTGIPEEISSKIFEPFFTTKSAIKGTGLGLSVSHGIIESHAGKIQVDSKPGEGTVFTLILPKT